MLLASYWKAFQGFILWNKIDRKYHAPFYLLLPKEKEVSNYYALLHLKRFLQVRGFGEAVVLTCDREAAASLELFLEGQSVGDMVKAVCICRKDAVKLLKYYALNEFTSRLTVVSFTAHSLGAYFSIALLMIANIINIICFWFAIFNSLENTSNVCFSFCPRP